MQLLTPRSTGSLARSYSLIVTMEVVKFQQAGFINYDLGE
jgi:hypothetical protein